MSEFEILTDTASDISETLARELNVIVLPMNVTLGDKQFKHFADFREMSIKDFYGAMSRGETASTAAVTPIEWEEEIERQLVNDRDVLVMPFSSGLSSTYENAVTAVNELRDRYPQRQIEVTDTRCVTVGLTLMLILASRWREEGRSLSEIRKLVDETAPGICHYFTVDDLGHLRRGGRISAATAVVGSALGIKPVLHVNNEGKLESVSKARGRKNSLKALSDYIDQLAIDPKSQTIMIANADCIDDATELANDIKNRFDCKDVIIGDVGPVIGAHAGSGLVLVSFIGKNR